MAPGEFAKDQEQETENDRRKNGQIRVGGQRMRIAMAGMLAVSMLGVVPGRGIRAGRRLVLGAASNGTDKQTRQ